MHPGGGFQRHTLRHFMGALYAPESPRPLLHLDAEASGVVVFARTRHFAAVLGPQFAGGAAEGGAGRVAFTHPVTGRRVVFSAEAHARL